MPVEKYRSDVEVDEYFIDSPAIDRANDKLRTVASDVDPLERHDMLRYRL